MTWWPTCSSSLPERACNLERLAVWFQYLLPKNGLSLLARAASRCRVGWFKGTLIGVFIRLFRVDMSQAQPDDPAAYESFNQFFTRSLKPGVRQIAPPEAGLACPCDGRVSQAGSIREGRIFQAKGQGFTAAELLGDEDLAAPFADGRFATLYLAPRDYHRVHMPTQATLETEIHIPGSLFSVNDRTARHIPGLFARNERLTMVFRTDQGEPLGLVMVAAMLVSGIETAWTNAEYRRPGQISRVSHETGHGPRLGRGEELGRFNWGSTVILLRPASAPEWRREITPGAPIRFGQALCEGTFDR